MTAVCIVITDILGGNYRQKLRSDDDCTALTRYRFSVGPLRTTGSITKAVLRAYLLVSPAHVTPEDGNNIVEVTVKARFYDPSKNTTITTERESEVYHVTLTSQSNDWVEMEVTQGLKDLPFFDIQETTQLELTLSLSAECMNKDRAPVAYFVDPATFLSSAMRARYMDEQPLLIVYTEYEQDKQLTFNPLLYGSERNSHPISKRSRQHVYPITDICERHEYTITFAEIDKLTAIIQPRSVDIGICRGSCVHYQQNIYELLLALAQEDDETDSGSGGREEKSGACVPAGFRSVVVLLHINGVLQIQWLKEAIVTECACENCNGIY